MPPVSSQRYLPVLYLPGAGGYSSAFRPIAERLASRRPPVLVDYPGLGDAPADPSVRCVADLVEGLAARLTTQVDVVARSMGCLVALELVLRHPERVRRLVLLVPAGGVDVARLGGSDWRPLFREERPSAPTWFVDDRTDLTPRLSEVRAPTLLILGDRDPISPVAVGEYLLQRLPAARLEVVPGASHDLGLEQPDVVASLVEAHLRGGD